MNTVFKADIQGKRILVRCDVNVPLDASGNILDDFRIRQIIPTLEYLLSKGARTLFLLSHLGDPGGKVVESLRLDPIQKRLSQLLDKPIFKTSDCLGREAFVFAKEMPEGSIVLLENVRFHQEEEQNDRGFAKQLAMLGDVYVNDAFSASHRRHATLATLPRLLPSFAGLLLDKEVSTLEYFSQKPERPFVVVVGGKKVKDKLSFIDAISKTADFVLLGNLLSQEVSKQNVRFLHPEKIILPKDGIPGQGKEYDIGPETQKLFLEKIAQAKSVFWTGPLGWIEQEQYAQGSLALAHAIIKHSEFSVAGGGNMSEFLDMYSLRDKFSYVSTGGGATLAFLAGEKLPGLAALGYYTTESI